MHNQQERTSATFQPTNYKYFTLKTTITKTGKIIRHFSQCIHSTKDLS